VVLGAIVLVTVVSACGSAGPPIGPDRPTTTLQALATQPHVADLEGLERVAVATGLDNPVAIAPAPRLHETFIVERTGRLVSASSGGTSAVLDLTSEVGWRITEQGFLGFIVHPAFPDDPRGFALYTNRDEDVVVTSFLWNGERFDASTGTRVLEVPQPHEWHQGGGMAFGPNGDLWLSFGDGGGNDDRFGNGQNPHTLNGTVVRIDIDSADPYAIPPTNPYDGKDGAREVWAIGLRNPWRITVDGDTLFIADVGFEAAEEINVVSTEDAGRNFGWPIVEGDGCYHADECDRDGLTAPTMTLARDDMCALIGGPVYRGSAIPEMRGQYVFGDHCNGWMRTVAVDGLDLGVVTDWEPMLGPIGNITTFGLDADGELLVATLEGAVYRIVPVRS
jgi:glucose/arabinose dehydrogenase